MPESEGPSASTGGGLSSSSLSHLPWGMIPAFKPGETDINEYTKRLEFLADLWPVEHLAHLAPRGAMLCEGGAFKRLMRVDAKKLKVNNLDGIKLLVSTLGGVWGKAKHEEKFERFERAIYSTVQRADETHESYLARHDFQFEELAALHVTIDEMRAYCLLRNSGLLMDEKKKIIMDSEGQLEYGKVVAALKVLGSRFFTELQTSGKSTTRIKTYEAANVMEEDEPPPTQGEDEASYQDHWDDDILLMSEENEQDVLVIQQFEDSLVDVLQNDPETAQCFHSYLEARKRISERNKNRGFWPVKGSGKTKSKTKFGFSSKGFGKNRKPLAQRILESECRRCGQKGHWKAECPRRFENDTKPPQGAFAGTVHAADMPEESDDMILVEEIDNFVAPCSLCQSVFCVDTMQTSKGDLGERDSVWGMAVNPIRQHAQRLTSSLKHLLKAPMPCESPLTRQTEKPASLERDGPSRRSPDQEALFVHHGPCGIVDLGASQTVIGQSQVHDLLKELPTDIRKQVRKIDCQTVFRFGNSSTVTCSFAYLIPLAHWFVKLCVVPSQTPFLISNNVFRKLGAIIDTEQAQIRFPKLALTMPLTLTDQQLFLLDFCSLVAQANRSRLNQTSLSIEKHALLHAHHTDQVSLQPIETLNQISSGSKTSDVSSNSDRQFNQSCSQPDDDFLTPSVGSSDSVDACSSDRSSHGPEDLRRHLSALPDSNSADSGPECQGRIHAHDHGGTRPSADHLRQREEGTALQRSRPGRSPVCGLVHLDVQGLRQDTSSEVHSLCAALHGRSGTAKQVRFSGEEHCNPGDSIEVKGSSQVQCLSGTKGEDADVLPVHDSSERSMGNAERRDCPPERSYLEHRGSFVPDRPAAAIPDSATECGPLTAVDSPQTAGEPGTV